MASFTGEKLKEYQCYYRGKRALNLMVLHPLVVDTSVQTKVATCSAQSQTLCLQ